MGKEGKEILKQLVILSSLRGEMGNISQFVNGVLEGTLEIVKKGEFKPIPLDVFETILFLLEYTTNRLNEYVQSAKIKQQ